MDFINTVQLDTNPKTENAFVVGGNYIYIYTTLIDNVHSDDELAMILGHEISHSWLKHGLRQAADSTNLVGSVAELLASLTNDANRRQTLGLVGGVVKNAYSRDDEREADALGAFIAYKSGYDPSQAVNTFRRWMQNESTANSQQQVQIAIDRQAVTKQLSDCQVLTAQWNSTPQLLRTQQNAQYVNSVCQTAEANRRKLNEYLTQSSRNQIGSIFLRDHPVDSERINSLLAETEFLRGRRSLDSLASIGQGYNVLRAINVSSSVDTQQTAPSSVVSSTPSTKAGPQISIPSNLSAKCADLEERAQRFASFDFVSAEEKRQTRSDADQCKESTAKTARAAAPSSVPSSLPAECADLEERAQRFASFDFTSAAEKNRTRDDADECIRNYSIPETAPVSRSRTSKKKGLGGGG